MRLNIFNLALLSVLVALGCAKGAGSGSSEASLYASSPTALDGCEIDTSTIDRSTGHTDTTDWWAKGHTAGDTTTAQGVCRWIYYLTNQALSYMSHQPSPSFWLDFGQGDDSVIGQPTPVHRFYGYTVSILPVIVGYENNPNSSSNTPIYDNVYYYEKAIIANSPPSTTCLNCLRNVATWCGSLHTVNDDYAANCIVDTFNGGTTDTRAFGKVPACGSYCLAPNGNPIQLSQKSDSKIVVEDGRYTKWDDAGSDRESFCQVQECARGQGVQPVKTDVWASGSYVTYFCYHYRTGGSTYHSNCFTQDPKAQQFSCNIGETPCS
jgi:hypothetical protein